MAPKKASKTRKKGMVFKTTVKEIPVEALGEATENITKTTSKNTAKETSERVPNANVLASRKALGELYSNVQREPAIQASSQKTAKEASKGEIPAHSSESVHFPEKMDSFSEAAPAPEGSGAEPARKQIKYGSNRSCIIQVAGEIGLRIKEIDETDGSCTVHITVIVISEEVACELAMLLRFLLVRTLAVDYQTPIKIQGQSILRNKVRVVCGTIERMNKLIDEHYIKKDMLKALYFIDPGVLFSNPNLQKPLDHLVEDLPESLYVAVNSCTDVKLKQFEGKNLIVFYYDMVPSGFFNAFHHSVLISKRNKGLEVRAISMLRGVYLNRRMVIYCEMDIAVTLNKKLAEKCNISCLPVIPNMNSRQRTKNYKQFLNSTNAVLLITNYFLGMINAYEPMVVICYHLPPVYEYPRIIGINEEAGENRTSFYILIYEGQQSELTKLRDKLNLRWTEETFI